jgi:hypothetical protein
MGSTLSAPAKPSASSSSWPAILTELVCRNIRKRRSRQNWGLRARRGGIVKLGGINEDMVRARAHEQYLHGCAKVEIGVGATALIVIDMLDEFVKPE